MQNMLLVGLSRQMVLERQMDVVANNVANVNTNGYKADRSMFQEYLASGAREDNFIGPDRRVSRTMWHYDRGSFPRTAQTIQSVVSGPLTIDSWDQFAIWHEYFVCVAAPKLQVRDEDATARN